MVDPPNTGAVVLAARADGTTTLVPIFDVCVWWTLLTQARWYSQQGLMAGSVFKAVLEDLEAEKHPLAKSVRNIMRNRTLVGVTYYSANSCGQHGNTQCPVSGSLVVGGFTTPHIKYRVSVRTFWGIGVFICWNWNLGKFGN